MKLQRTYTSGAYVDSVLRIDLAGAADPEMHTLVSYHDIDRLTGQITYGSHDDLSDDTTNTSILDHPAADIDRVIDEIQVFNEDNAAATITLEIYDGTNAISLFRAVTAAGDHIHWSPAQGWSVVSALGYLMMTPHA